LLTGFNEKKKNEILFNEITGYRSIDFLNKINDSYVYQMGFEDSIFYFKNPILGEVFEPGRYHDFRSISSEALSKKFSKLGITHFIINTDRFPFVTSRENFLKYFQLIHKDKSNEVYILLNK